MVAVDENTQKNRRYHYMIFSKEGRQTENQRLIGNPRYEYRCKEKVIALWVLNRQLHDPTYDRIRPGGSKKLQIFFYFSQKPRAKFGTHRKEDMPKVNSFS